MDYKLEDLIDIPLFQNLQEKLNLFHSFPSAIIDNEGKILTAVAWQDICTKFHRLNPQSEKECIKSDQYILTHLHEANPAVSYRCPHGLDDNAIPIIIDGKHLGNFFTGQFFTEKPDLGFFKKQAKKYGFDEKAYLDAVKKVPIWSKNQVITYLDFIKTLIEIIAGIGLENQKGIEVNKFLKESEDRYRALTENAHGGIVLLNKEGKFKFVSASTRKIFGYSESEEITDDPAEFTHPDDLQLVLSELDKVIRDPSYVPTLKYRFTDKNGNWKWIESTFTNLFANPSVESILINFHDINERQLAEQDILLLAHAVKSTKECISITDKQNNILFVNQSFLETYGYCNDELIGQNISIVNSQHNPPGIMQDIHSATLLSGWKGEILNRKKDGSEFPVSLSTSLVYNQYGNTVSLIGVATDITGRKQLEAEAKRLLENSERSRETLLSILEDQTKTQEALKESAMKWQSTFDGIRDSIFLLDNNGIILQTNQSSKNILGKSKEEIVGRHCHEIVHNINCHLKGCPFIRMKKSKQRETMILPDDNRWFEILVDPILDAENNLTGAVHFICDITERKLAERDIEILSLRNKAILEAIPDILMEVDTDKVYTWANHAGIEFFGDDVIGKEANFYFEGEQPIYELIQPIFAGGEDVIYIESLQRRRDGEKRLLAWYCSVLKDANGKVRGSLSSARDITEIKKTEKEILLLNTKLEHRVIERTAQLESVNNELEAFSYSVSHDLRAPLRHISGYVDLLNSRFHESLTEKGKHYLNNIAGSAHQMGVLIDDLLQFSRSSRKEIRQTDLDMNVVLQEALKTVKQDISGRNIKWTFGPLPHVYGDNNLLQLVWINLLSNAVKFTMGKKIARIETGFRDGIKEYLFFIHDNGAGFDMKYADKLFGVFQRLHSSQDFEGTGIGLANVHRIITKHGGRTWAEAKPDKGATFYFTLPKEEVDS